MKSNITRTLALTVLTSIVVSACGPKSDKEVVEKKKAEVEKLKAERTKLNDKITALTAEISKLTGGEENLKSKDVAVKAVTTSSFDHTVKTQGAVESLDNIQVSAKTPGVVTQVFVTEGQNVSAGQVLGQIDNSLIIRGIEELKSNLDLAKTVFDRQKNLWDQKIGTEVQYLQAKNNKESLERRLASLNEQNEQTRIKSPISGSVDEVTVKVGQNIAPGMPAVRIVNNSDLKVKAKISESYIPMIRKGNKAIITVPDLNNKVINAKVTFVGSNIDPLSRTFAVEVKLPSSSDLRPNMTVEIKIVFETVDEAIVVPMNVVQNVNGEKVIYTIETKGNKTLAHKNVVKVAGVFDDQAQISEGLKKGDQIITVGFQGLNDGDLVKI